MQNTRKSALESTKIRRKLTRIKSYPVRHVQSYTCFKFEVPYNSDLYE